SRVNYLYPEAINSIYFLDSLIGLAGCTGGVLVKTSDGGISWTQLATTFNSGNFNSIRFNGETGFIILDIDNIQILLRSSDSGMNWAETYSDTLVKLTSINITGPNVFVTGTNGRILKSFDNGINWVSNKGNVQRGFSYIKFLNENTGIAADWGSNYPTFKMYGTTTGGQNWFVRGNVTNVNSIFSIEFVDMNTGYMVGGNSNLYAKIYKTTNCGVVWNELAFPANETIADVDFINAETGIVCGGGGLIARTTNGALSWEVTNRGGPDWNGAICFADLSNCFSANSAGTIYKSSNAGASWIIASTVGTSIDEINFVNSLTGFIAASNGVYRTTDGGYSWTNISGAGTYHDLKFYDSNTGFVSAYNGRLARTTNSGQSWIDESYISPGLNYNSFCFINSEVVYMLGSNNLFKTTNGGVLTNYIGSESQTAQSFRLFQNYPNPFNPSTKIMYEIPRSSFVSIKVFDNLGKELKELVYEFKRQGIFEVTFDGNNLPSGIYYCRLECFDQNKSSNSLIQVQKMILIK
ncbi:MAG: T9SS type A sorting domain-containing protein, partial [bacterium]